MSRTKTKAISVARYEDPQLLRDVREWFYCDSDARASAHQFAQAHSYAILNSILPALKRVGEYTGKRRESAICEEITLAAIKSVSPKMFRTFVYAVFDQPPTASVD